LAEPVQGPGITGTKITIVPLSRWWSRRCNATAYSPGSTKNTRAMGTTIRAENKRLAALNRTYATVIYDLIDDLISVRRQHDQAQAGTGG
jgi:hypothetical protein